MESVNSIDMIYGTEIMFKMVTVIILSLAALFDIRSKKIPVSFPIAQFLYH